MHQLHRITIRQGDLGEPRAAHDLAIQLDDDLAGIQFEMPQQISKGGRSGNLSIAAVDGNSKILHEVKSKAPRAQCPKAPTTTSW